MPVEISLDFAEKYVSSRANELAYKNGYALRLRHLVIKPQETREIKAYNQLYFMVHAEDDLMVIADFGYFNPQDTKTNEQLYEFKGKIQITNSHSTDVRNVKFIQIVPKAKKKQCQ